MDSASSLILDMVEQDKRWLGEFPTKIGKGRRITITKDFLEALNLAEGDPVWIGIRKQEGRGEG